MNTNWRTASKKCAAAGLLGAGLAIALCAPSAQAAETAAAGPDARAIVMNMAQYLAGLQEFRTELNCGYDSVQASGKKIEFMEKRVVTVDRPGRLRVELEQSDGDQSLVLIDGRTITAQNLTKNVYAQTEAKTSLDESLKFFIQGLQMRFPLALLMINNLPAELGERLTDVQYVEQTSILGEPAHHIAGSTETVDFQVWIDAGKKPLLRRIVLTYPNEDGQPQFRAHFMSWDLSPRIRDSAFEFEAPKGASRIAFVTQLQAAGAMPSTKTAQGASR